MKWKLGCATPLLATAIGLSACELNGPSEPTTWLNSEKSYTITIMEEQDFFMDRFGKLVIARFPNVDFRFVTPVLKPEDNRSTALLQFLDQHKPDLLYLDHQSFQELAKANRLHNLEPLVTAEKYELDAFHPGVLEQLRALGAEQLVGLAPTFMKKGLFYNLDLFDLHGLPYPTERMTWNEVASLAQRLPLSQETANPLFGIYFNELFGGEEATYSDRMMELGVTSQLGLFNRSAAEQQLHDSSWKGVWDFLKTQYQSGVFKNAANGGQTPDYFLTGHAGMALAPNVYVTSLQRNSSLKWGVTTEPIGKSHPDHSYSLQLPEVYAISGSSPQKEAVWELLKFMLSEEVASLLAQSASYSHLLPSRESSAPRQNDLDYSVFFALKHWLQPVPENTDLPSLQKALHLAENELKEVIENNKPVDQAWSEFRSGIASNETTASPR